MNIKQYNKSDMNVMTLFECDDFVHTAMCYVCLFVLNSYPVYGKHILI